MRRRRSASPNRRFPGCSIYASDEVEEEEEGVEEEDNEKEEEEEGEENNVFCLSLCMVMLTPKMMKVIFV